MVTIRLNELLVEREKTLYWLAQKTRVRYATLWQMSRDEVVLVNLKTLDKICRALGVEPGDVLVRKGRR
jgi:DNA-binding Xre family transcriptional regulator